MRQFLLEFIQRGYRLLLCVLFFFFAATRRKEGAVVAKVAVFFRALLMFGRQEIPSLYGESNEVEEDTWCTPMPRKIMGH